MRRLTGSEAFETARRAAATAAVALVVGCGVASEAPPPAPRNVLLVLVDTLRADHLGAYGYARATSPNIDRFAEGSLLFEQARAQAPCTFPSVNSLLSARYPQRFEEKSGMGIPPHFATLQKVLSERGWKTAAISASPIVRRAPSAFNPTGGFGRDFDVFHEECLFDDAACVNREVERLLDSLGEPFFIYAHYLDPHNPYRPPASHLQTLTRPYRGHDFVAEGDTKKIGAMLYRDGPKLGLGPADWRHLVDLYDEEIRYVDERFQDLLTALEARSLGESTLVALVSDHGEEFLEHGAAMHCRNLYDTQLRTPIILRVPGATPRRIARSVDNVDLVPTILDYLGIDPAPFPFDGRSLRALAEGAGDVPARSFGAWGGRRSVVEGGLKLIVDVRTDAARLYDVLRDPRERNDLSRARPGDVARLRRILDAHREVAEADAIGPADHEATERRLRELGYLE